MEDLISCVEPIHIHKNIDLDIMTMRPEALRQFLVVVVLVVVVVQNSFWVQLRLKLNKNHFSFFEILLKLP